MSTNQLNLCLVCAVDIKGDAEMVVVVMVEKEADLLKVCCNVLMWSQVQVVSLMTVSYAGLWQKDSEAWRTWATGGQDYHA